MLDINRWSVLSPLHRFLRCRIIKRLSVFSSSLKPEIASILAQMFLMLVYFSTPYLSSPNGLLASCKWEILISVHPNFSENKKKLCLLLLALCALKVPSDWNYTLHCVQVWWLVCSFLRNYYLRFYFVNLSCPFQNSIKLKGFSEVSK